MILQVLHCPHCHGRNEMDPPLCGSTAMSHNEFQSSEPMEPQEASPMKHEMHVLGIDLAKRVFHAVGMDERVNVVYRKRIRKIKGLLALSWPHLASTRCVGKAVQAGGGERHRGVLGGRRLGQAMATQEGTRAAVCATLARRAQGPEPPRAGVGLGHPVERCLASL